jgi:transcriptional regulator with XRE-family HTH domain
MHVSHESQQLICGPCIMPRAGPPPVVVVANTQAMRKRYTAVRYRLVDAMGQLTQEEVAKKLEISQSSLSRMLSPSGMRLTVDFVLRFAEVVGADPAYLLTGRSTVGAVPVVVRGNTNEGVTKKVVTPDTVQPLSLQNAPGLRVQELEAGLLRRLEGHEAALQAVFGIARFVKNHPDLEEAMTDAVLTTIEQLRGGSKNPALPKARR